MLPSSSLRARWGEATHAQRITAVAIIATLCGLILLLGRTQRDGQEKVLRDQFHLPDDVAFVVMEHGSAKLRWPRLRATAQLSDAALASYVGGLDRVEIWRPTPLHYRGVSRIDAYGPGALTWRSERPPPAYGSDGMASGGIFADPDVQAIRRGRYFCFAVLPLDPGPPPADPRHRAVPCSDLPRGTDPVAVVQGALDLDRRALHMGV
ncbi:hypothetical protein HZ989_03235 [Brevundimonas sp. AJA228-03]|uniref:hypothetical protein n=1 Tax=Brevundimonas sp. AJA228-03 TaxID=2752515 RepID=UPI001AE09C0F|nr:hypothetical protein [Brevundimonas sp. AJA228-03]QTN20109.1 hypothetical protein HZ989_03235 [Brevundimonas sp. AJA228-03]